MASVQTNISKGSEVRLYDNVKSNNPANSALIMLVLATGSAGGVDGIVDLDTVAAITAGGYTEVGNTGYSRIVMTDADLVAWAPDDTNNRVLLTLPLQTWAAVTAGDNWDIVVVAYDNDTTGGTDANLIPITASEIRENGTAIVPSGDPVVIDFSSGWIAAV